MNTRKNHYDAEFYEKIRKHLKEEKYEKLNKEFAWYLQKYPKDAVAIIHYIDYLLKIGNFDEAAKYLSDIIYLPNFNRVKRDTYHILLAKLKCYQKDFNGARNYLNLLSFAGSKQNKIAETFILKQLNMENNDKLDNSYIAKQIQNYSKQRLLNYLNKHSLNDINCNNKFASDFPFNEIYGLIKEKLPTEHHIYYNIPCYYTTFKYNNCGEVMGKSTDYFRVLALNFTNEIITIYPYIPSEVVNCTDLNPNLTETDVKKVRRISQVDKFNNRYRSKNK